MQSGNISQPHSQVAEHHPIVLIVDDSAAIRDMLSWALELDGYEPIEAAEGQEAFAWMDNSAREGRYPAVILLDLAMPGMDGDAFLHRLHTQWEEGRPQSAIVLITADASGTPKAHSTVQHVIVKPFQVRNLLDVVRTLTD